MGPLERLLRFSLRHRLLVVAGAVLLTLAGALFIATLPVDIFPDLSAPTVTVITEAAGMAAEEVELLVTFPVESAVNGSPGVRRLRSVSADGLSVAWVEFDWGTDIYRARQVVSERLQRVDLPAQAEQPELGPISSIMGEITFIAMTAAPEADGGVSAMELRRVAETVVRRTLLSIPGVSQVVPIGGERRQLQVTVRPAALAQNGLPLTDVIEAVAAASRSLAAGFHVEGGQEHIVRGLTRARSPEDVAAAVVRVEGGVPLRVGDVATVEWGAEPARGTASYRNRPAVILSVQKQPEANTLELTRAIDAALARLRQTLPSGVVLESENFRQADFIEVAIGNVSEALRWGAILVIVILALFLGSVRTTLISAFAIPLSLVTGILVIAALGLQIDTMTLGGLSIAVGLLVDDAIIAIENIFRRLKEERRLPRGDRRPAAEVGCRGDEGSAEPDPHRHPGRRPGLRADLLPARSGGSAAPAARPRLHRGAVGLARGGADRHAGAGAPVPGPGEGASRPGALAFAHSARGVHADSQLVPRAPLGGSPAGGLGGRARGRARARSGPQLPARVQRGIAHRCGRQPAGDSARRERPAGESGRGSASRLPRGGFDKPPNRARREGRARAGRQRLRDGGGAGADRERPLQGRNWSPRCAARWPRSPGRPSRSGSRSVTGSTT